MTEKIPTTYNSFDNIQLAILIEVVGLIIPKSTKYEAPGADDPKIFSKILCNPLGPSSQALHFSRFVRRMQERL